LLTDLTWHLVDTSLDEEDLEWGPG